MELELNRNIASLIDKLGITPYAFSKLIGNRRPDNLYKIIKYETAVSPKTLGKIFTRFPEYKNFILTGEVSVSKKKRLTAPPPPDKKSLDMQRELQKKKNEIEKLRKKIIDLEEVVALQNALLNKFEHTIRLEKEKGNKKGNKAIRRQVKDENIHLTKNPLPKAAKGKKAATHVW
jgi:hypothetical protein